MIAITEYAKKTAELNLTFVRREECDIFTAIGHSFLARKIGFVLALVEESDLLRLKFSRGLTVAEQWLTVCETLDRTEFNLMKAAALVDDEKALRVLLAEAAGITVVEAAAGSCLGLYGFIGVLGEFVEARAVQPETRFAELVWRLGYDDGAQT